MRAARCAICPRIWRLPRGVADGDSEALLATLGIASPNGGQEGGDADRLFGGIRVGMGGDDSSR